MEWFLAAIQRLLSEPGMSQTRLAERIGASQSAISAYARGDIGPQGPTLAIAMKVLEAIGGDIARALPGATLEPADKAELNLAKHNLIQALERLEEMKQRDLQVIAMLSRGIPSKEVKEAVAAAV